MKHALRVLRITVIVILIASLELDQNTCYAQNTNRRLSRAVSSGIVEFKLIDAESGLVLGSVKKGDIIDLEKIDHAKVNFQVNVTPDIESVRFRITGTGGTRTDTSAPFTLLEDNELGGFTPNPNINYRITATPFKKLESGRRVAKKSDSVKVRFIAQSSPKAVTPAAVVTPPVVVSQALQHLDQQLSPIQIQRILILSMS
jgi:hypothetical protein